LNKNCNQHELRTKPNILYQENFRVVRVIRENIFWPRLEVKKNDNERWTFPNINLPPA